MRNGSTILKRSQAMALVVAMMLSLLSQVFCIGAFAEEKTSSSVSEGKLIADNYEISDAEKGILSSGCLVEKVHTFTKPESSDNLISVDGEAHKITAKSYSENGYTWNAVVAKIITSDGSVQETVALAGGAGTYTYDGNAFSVDVTYRLEINVADDTQKALLGVPAMLKGGVDNLDKIFSDSANSDLGIIALSIPFLKEVHGTRRTLIIGEDEVNLKVSFGDEAWAAIQRLAAQLEKNGNDSLDLTVAGVDCGKSSSKISYLSNNGVDLKNTLSATYEDVKTIRNDGLMNNSWLDAGLEANEPATYKQMQAVKGAMDRWIETAGQVSTAVGDSLWNVTALKDDLSSTQYLALDVLVAKLGDTVDLSGLKIKNPLSMDTTIRYNMSMSEVTVKVVLMVSDGMIGSSNLKEIGSKTVSLTMMDGSTKAEIEAEVKKRGIVDDAISGWSEYDEANFKVETSELPNNLAGDTTYVITYSPVIYDVTLAYDGGRVEKLPYGACMLLETCKDDGVVYDYTVNGSYYPEGSLYTVSGDATIDRSTGKPYVGTTLNRLVGDVYFSNNDKAMAILSSGALTVGNDAINVRYPDNDNGSLVTVNDKGVLIARDYPASYNGLKWVADTYTVVDGSNEFKHSFSGSTEVVIAEAEYDRIDVTYRLDITNFEDSKVLEVLNIPSILNSEAKSQIEVLKKINNYQSNIRELNRVKLGALSGVIDVSDLNDDAAKNEELKAYFKTVVGDIIAKCLDGDVLRLATLLSGYDNGGLGYYYEHSQEFINEINLLGSYLTAMVKDEEKKAALEVLITSAGYPEYAEKIQNLEKVMAEVSRDLVSPNALIDVNSPNLPKLVNALTTTGDVPTYTKLPNALYIESDKIVINAETKTTVSIKLQIENGKLISLAPKTFDRNHILTESDISELLAQIDAAIVELGVSDKYWVATYDRAIFEKMVGHRAADLDKTYSFIWAPKNYVVHIYDAEDQVINIQNLLVKIPERSGVAYRYDYIVDGKVVTGSYSFTTEQLDKLFVDGEYTISAIRVDVTRERLTTFVNRLNDSIKNGALVFALLENEGKYSIVSRVNTADPEVLTAALRSVTNQLVNSGYGYIGLDNDGLMYLDETNALKVSLQAVANAVMNSGFGTDTLLDVMDANGVIRHMKLDGTIISDKVIDSMGGELVKTTMQLGNAADDAMELQFYITLNNSSPALIKLRNMLSGRAGSYMSVVCENGKVNLKLTLPQKAYEAYLAVLLVSNRVDITDLNSVNGEIAISFLKDLMDPILAGDSVTTTTLTNTLNKFGYNIDLTDYESYFRNFCEIYNSCEFTYGETSGEATGKLSISKFVDRLNLGDLGKMIVEYDSGLDIAVSVDVANLANDYDALYLDIRADRKIDKIGLTQDLGAKLKAISGGAVIVLLRDVEGDLVLNTKTVLNLNGYTVKGDVICNGEVVIIDTASVTGGFGKVNGEVTGKATIVAGQYASDVTAFIRNGYTQDSNGTVTNNFYALKKDSEGNVTLEVNADLLKTDFIPDIKTLLVDLAADLLINGYTVNKLYINGNLIYNVTLEDFVGLYFGTDRAQTLVDKAVEMFDVKQLATLVNRIIADLTDFAKLQDAINSDSPLLSYSMSTGNWEIALSHNTEKDYLTLDVLSESDNNATLNVVLTGSNESKKLLADLCGELKKILNVDMRVDFAQGFNASNDKNFVINGTAIADVSFDLSDPNYAVLLSVLIANGVGSPAKDDLVAGIKKFYEIGDFGQLKVAFEALTTSQVITALKNLSSDADFMTALKALGLDDIISERAVELESIYEAFVKVAAAIVRRLDTTGGNRTLGSYLKDGDIYGGSKNNIYRKYTRDLFRGYSLTLDMSVTRLSIGVKMFAEGSDPLFEGAPVIGKNDSIIGSTVSVEGGYIILEVNVDGIKASELKKVIEFKTLYADELEIVIVNVADKDRIHNGAKLTATAKNTVTGATAVAEYTVVILGDTNCNGRVDIGDAQIISAFLADKQTLDKWQQMAADINKNDRTDIGDAALIAAKLVEQDDQDESVFCVE